MDENRRDPDSHKRILHSILRRIEIFLITVLVIYIILFTLNGFDRNLDKLFKTNKNTAAAPENYPADSGNNKPTDNLSDKITSSTLNIKSIKPTPIPPDLSDIEAAKKFYTIDLSETSYPDDEFLNGIRNIKGSNYHNNPLYYYQLASHGVPVISPEMNETINDVLTNGWDDEKHKTLLPWLEISAPAIVLIFKGNDAPDLQWIPPDAGMLIPVPNFKMTINQINALCISGKKLEKTDDINNSIKFYAASLRMGRNFISPGSNLISALIGVKAETIAIRCLFSLIQNKNLNKEQLLLIRNLAQETVSKNTSLKSVFATEEHLMHITIKEMADGLVKAVDKPNKSAQDKKMVSYAKETVLWNEDFSANRQKYVEIPFVNRPNPIPEINETKYDKDNPILQIVQAIARPNVNEADARYSANTMSLHALALLSAAHLYKLDKEKFPEDPEALVPDYIDQIPDDLFCKNKIQYKLDKTTNSPVIWSAAPDKTDNKAEIVYDPTNGTFSAGDLVFANTR